MIRLVIANQKGGVAKTTTTLSLAREFADRGLKVLLIDIDPRDRSAPRLGLKTTNYLYSFVISNYRFKDCLVAAHANIDVLCSNRETTDIEGILHLRTGRELIFQVLLTPVEKDYDAVIIDCPPAISLLQSCALMYAQQILIPLTMDPLSLQGAYAAIQTSATLNRLFKAKHTARGRGARAGGSAASNDRCHPGQPAIAIEGSTTFRSCPRSVRIPRCPRPRGRENSWWTSTRNAKPWKTTGWWPTNFCNISGDN